MAEAQTPSVSVIVRTLGTSEHICDALESLAHQARKDFEVVLVDMSKGTVAPLLARVSSQLPNLRHLQVGRPLTRPVALNIGVVEASAPLIAILDEDDLYAPSHLDLLMSAIEASSGDYVYCGVRHATYAPDGSETSGGEVSIPYRFEQLIFDNYIDATGSLYRKALWEKIGGYDERFEVYADWEFLIRAAKASKIVYLPKVSGESREFVGIAGVSSRKLEEDRVRRCLAGVYWKHRRLYRGTLLLRLGYAWAEHYRRCQLARGGWRSWSVAGWRPEMVGDLIAWWRFDRAWLRGEFALTPRASGQRSAQ